MFVGKPLASPLALPFCAPWLVYGETVVAVDGANRFDLYRLTEWAKRKHQNPLPLLQRLQIARAFTPFQLATILQHIGGEMKRHRSTRLVITGLPDCLYDEELSEHDARTTFARCRENLARLAECYTVLTFSDAPLHPIADRARSFASLTSLAVRVYKIENTEPVLFVPIKAPGLLTISKGELVHGQNHTDG
jgi:hypothetical protein